MESGDRLSIVALDPPGHDLAPAARARARTTQWHAAADGRRVMVDPHFDYELPTYAERERREVERALRHVAALLAHVPGNPVATSTDVLIDASPCAPRPGAHRRGAPRGSPPFRVLLCGIISAPPVSLARPIAAMASRLHLPPTTTPRFGNGRPRRRACCRTALATSSPRPTHSALPHAADARGTSFGVRRRRRHDVAMEQPRRDAPHADSVRTSTARQDAPARVRPPVAARDRPQAITEQMHRWETEGGSLGHSAGRRPRPFP